MTRAELIVLLVIVLLVAVIPALLAWLVAPIAAGLWWIGLACLGLAAYIVIGAAR